MLVAFHGSQEEKTAILAQLQAHHDADEIVQGKYWENGKGCAVGCTIHGTDHAAYEPKFGIPMTLAHLEDAIFEGLTHGDAKAWPLRFMTAIHPGTDLSMVWSKFACWMLAGLSKVKDEACAKAVADVLALYEEWIKTGVKPEKSRWAAARDAGAAARDARDAGAAALWAAARVP